MENFIFLRSEPKSQGQKHLNKVNGCFATAFIVDFEQQCPLSKNLHQFAPLFPFPVHLPHDRIQFPLLLTLFQMQFPGSYKYHHTMEQMFTHHQGFIKNLR